MLLHDRFKMYNNLSKEIKQETAELANVYYSASIY